jgi:hypothetical protein
LKPRSFRPLVSVTRPTLNSPPLASVVVPLPLSSLPPHPAASSASAATSGTNVFFTSVSRRF